MSAANVDIMSVMGSDVAELYTNYGKLSAASLNPAQMALEAPSYQAILASVKGSDAVKQLAADYIPQFLHHFPALVESGINAQLDLIEDENATIRIHAIRGLEGIAKHNPSTVGRIADVLAQLLVVPDALEMNVVKATFHALFKIDAKAAFLALFTQATAAPDIALRKTVREFIQAQLRPLTPALKKDAAAATALCAGLKALLGAAQPSADLLLAPSELQFFLQALIAFCPHAGNAAKIRADEPLKTELAIIAANQAGLKPGSGALDTTNEASLKHFLEVQSIMGRLQKDYGVDSTPFIAVYFGQLLPSIDTIADAELRAKVLQAIAANATNLSAKQAQTYFATFFAGFKQALPKGEIAAPVAAAAAAGDAAAAAAAPAASPVPSADAGAKINFSTAEVYLYLFHIFAPLAPTELKAATGIFQPTGQPGESLTAPNEKRDEFLNRIQYLLQSNASYKASLHAVQKTLREQISAAGKALALAKAKENGAKAKAALPALAGQPTGPEKAAEPAAAAATDATPAGPTTEEQTETLKSLRAKAASVDAAIRISANAVTLAQPLLHKPLPNFLAPANMHLSWRQHKAGKEGQTQQGKGKPTTGKPAAGAKQPQGGKQQPVLQGQKRKSSGPDASTKSASNKKRGANQQQQGGQQQQQGAKKARREGSQQQQGNGARSGKKQKQRR